MELNFTLIIIIATVAITVPAFGSNRLFNGLLLNPYKVARKLELYRLVTHGFLHADWMHLIINMLVLYSFGSNVERWFAHLGDAGYLNNPGLTYGMLYFGGIIIASLISLYRYRNDPYYNSVGASGAVSAVVFTSIFLSPLDRLYLFAAIPIPGIVFAILYLLYSSYMSRRNRDNINHDAHFAGAVFGFVFPVLIHTDLLSHFLRALNLG